MGAAKARIAICLLACPLAFAADALPAGFNLSEPAPGVFVHLGRQLALDVPGHDDIANIGFIVGAKCVAVIDSGGSVSVGRELRAAIVKRTSLPICYVINTHVHVDHVLGNAAFIQDKPSFVGNSTLADAIARSRAFFVQEYSADLNAAPSGVQVIGPDRLVEQELSLDLGGRTLALRAWPKAHTDSDLTAFDPQTGTLWTGDLLFRERLPALDGSLTGWLAALDQLTKIKARLAVPGHGSMTRDPPAAIREERRYLQALADGVRAELVRNESIEHAILHVAASEHAHWLLWDKVHPHNVVRASQEAEWQ
jgi:quinoprotein relay system zinc metallohydrolase 2